MTRAASAPPVEASRVRYRTYTVIFGHDTRPGRIFDIVLIAVILASVLVIMLESVASVRAEYGSLLRGAEWVFTLLLTIEYVTRLWCVGRPSAYAKSALGLINRVFSRIGAHTMKPPRSMNT